VLSFACETKSNKRSEDLRGSVMIVATTAEEIRAMNCLVVPRRLLESVPGDNVARRKERKGKQRKAKEKEAGV
jgi:hypothetical protein